MQVTRLLILSLVLILTTALSSAAIDFTTGVPADLLSERRGWLPTGENNSLERDRTLFYFSGRGTGTLLNTDSELTNIHNHFKNGGAGRLSNYTYRGQMRVSEESSGIGITFHSQYPNADEYYRLRRYNTGSFHIAPHPDGYELVCENGDTEVVPQPDTWYKFKISVQTRRQKTVIRAKIWELGTAQPRVWQAICEDQNSPNYRRGKPGVWSMGPGTKSWRKLQIIAR